MRLLSIAGARPQFVKLAVVARAIAQHPSAEHLIVHTGQHYDDAMSGAFFRELDIPQPQWNLGVGSGTHAFQTGEMIRLLEPVLDSVRPDWVILYGDTNSTAAGALTASKMHLKVAHVEAGMRSFNRRMPEEINRIVADHLSDLLFSPTQSGMQNLSHEGLADRALLSGDVMFDAVLTHLSRLERANPDFLAKWEQHGAYALATIHRAENTDDPLRLRALLTALDRVAIEVCPVFLAIHPRTRKALEQLNLKPQFVSIIQPLSYAEMLIAQSRSSLVLTDSGGIQREAYFLQVPCLTLRDETEWVETLENRCNVLTGADPDKILAAATSIDDAGPWGSHYGTGNAGELIANALLQAPSVASLHSRNHA